MSERLREWIGFEVYRIGKLICRLGDWIGGWGGSHPFAAGVRFGRQLEREAQQKRERRALGPEW